MSLGEWAKLLVEHKFCLTRIPMSFWITFFGAVNSASNRLQAKLHYEQACATPLVSDPVFILGHWRTGTTLLHTLFHHDERFWTPTTYECLAPGHFILSADKFPKLMQFPSRRPMDNMSMGWFQPQEDEFALCIRGASSVYRNIAFPNHQVSNLESLTLGDLPAAKLDHWKATFRQFVTYLNYARQRTLIMKSPTHTGRIRVLLDMFPDAKFVHITRSPYDFIPSTIYLWDAMDATNGLQRNVSKVDREDYVFDCFQRMYQGFEQGKHEIPPHNFCEVAFDDLTERPIDVMRGVYQQLRLADFSDTEDAMTKFVESSRSYMRNRHELTSRMRSRITEHCGSYIQNYLPKLNTQAA
jgi:hypothetical protein